MKKIIPYKTRRNALASLDNGGRFYNLSSKSNDGTVTSAELAKAAGVFSSKQKMMLFLEMSLAELKNVDREEIITNLSDDLTSAYRKYRPQLLQSSEANVLGKLSSSAIITGIPKLIDSKVDFTGFIMVPIITDKTTTFIMIPLMDQYDVYELRDNETSKEFFIAHSRGSNKLPKSLIRCGGVLKELKTKIERGEASIFLETIYYSIV